MSCIMLNTEDSKMNNIQSYPQITESPRKQSFDYLKIGNFSCFIYMNQNI